VNRDLAEVSDGGAKAASRYTAERMVRNFREACSLPEDCRSIAAGAYFSCHHANHDIAEIVRVLDGCRDLDTIFAW
jgi:hypothetical protein